MGEKLKIQCQKIYNKNPILRFKSWKISVQNTKLIKKEEGRKLIIEENYLNEETRKVNETGERSVPLKYAGNKVETSTHPYESSEHQR